MRTIGRTSSFKRDYKREIRNARWSDQAFIEVISALANDISLPEKFRDHALSGAWNDHRDCHIRPDLVLIYRKSDDQLQLVRVGSHSELGL